MSLQEFWFEVDFQRDIRKGDVFEVLYERYADDNNKIIKTGKILYAYLNVNNQKIKLYRFGKKMIMIFTMKKEKYKKSFNENSNKWSTFIISVWHA